MRAPGRLRQVAGLPAPESVKRLSETWQASEALDPKGLADALSCAARAVKTVTSYEKVELLWTGPDSDELRRNLQGLLEVIRSARESLWVVSYAVGGDIDDVLVAMQERAVSGVDVQLLLDHRLDNFEHTRSRVVRDAPDCELLIWPDELREIRPRQFANLHAKCAIADGRQAFVSSANLTGWAMEKNLEVGYLVTGGSTPRELMGHFEDLRGAGHLRQLELW
jgi:phosphatidylserine/phosphatidylglycerophosphate/cardiolipin synthase-like enzyme